MNIDDFILTGKLSRPFGVRGEILFYTFSGDSSHLQTINTVYLEKTQKALSIEYWLGLATKGAKIRCKLQNIDSPESAKLLCGQNVWIPKKDAASLSRNEYYSADLISVTVQCNDEEVGYIEAVSDDAIPLLKIHWNSGNYAIIPFNKYFFSEPDLKKNTISLLDSKLLDLP